MSVFVAGLCFGPGIVDHDWRIRIWLCRIESDLVRKDLESCTDESGHVHLFEGLDREVESGTALSCCLQVG